MQLGSRSGRTPVDTHVEFSFGGTTERVAGRTRELSIGTAVFDTDIPPPHGPPACGSDIRVFLKVPGHVEEHEIPAKVRWLSDRIMGVQFGTLGAKATYQLTEMLWERRTSPPPPPVDAGAQQRVGYESERMQASGEWQVQSARPVSGEWNRAAAHADAPSGAHADYADYWAELSDRTGE